MKPNEHLDADLDAVLDEQRITRRHFFRPSIISMVIGIVLIGGLFTWQPPDLVAFEAHRPITILEHSGAVLLNLSDVKNHIDLPIVGNYRRYWIGPITGSKYTINCVTPGILQVGYLGSDQTLPNQILIDGILPRVRVTAYENRAIYNIHVHSFTGDSMTNLTNSRGDALSIDTTSFTRVVIGPISTQEVITIDYSSPQSIASIVHDSEILTKM